MNNKLLFTFLIALLSPLFEVSAAGLCESLLALQTRNTSDKVLDYYDDKSYVEFSHMLQSNGVMADSFDIEFDTRIYHGNTALPNLNTGLSPKVDPRARGLFVFLHGSGTMTATGRNFNSLMNSIHFHGFAGLSFDLPYHADGPMDERFNDPAFFMKWIKGIIEKYRQPGMPVYLIGHSYGAELIPEFMHRHPRIVQGGLSVSMVGFTKVLQDWYLKRTSRMDFGVVTNTMADRWADAVAEKFTWKKGEARVHNLRVLTGDREEFVPGPVGGKSNLPTGPNTYDYRRALLGLIPDAEVIVESGVGHYIFEHQDQNGRNVMMREILNTAGLDPSLLDNKTPPRTNSLYPNSDAVLQKYASDPIFKAWVAMQYPRLRAFFQKLRKSDERVSKKILMAYEAHKKDREAQLNL